MLRVIEMPKQDKNYEEFKKAWEEVTSNSVTDLLLSDPVGREILILQFLSLIQQSTGKILTAEEKIRWRNIVLSDENELKRALDDIDLDFNTLY